MSRSTLSLTILATLVAGLLFSSPAFAQSTSWSDSCADDGTLFGVFCALSTEFRFLPKALALLSYATGVTLFFLALMGWKKYGDDPTQTSVRDLVMKMVVGAFLISLPLAMQMVVKTVAGKGMDDSAAVSTITKRPCSARGSTLDSGMTSRSGC